MDDMGNAWTDIAFMTEAQYQDRLAERRARAEARSGATAGSEQE